MNFSCEPHEDVVFYIFPLHNIVAYALVYICCLVAAIVIGAYSYQLYWMVAKVIEVLHEQMPPVIDGDDKVGKETAYRNTKLTGVTEGVDGGGGTVANGPPVSQTKEDSKKEQITKIEEKMAPEPAPRKQEPPKSVGLKKVNSGPRSVFMA
uniref:Pecanex-like protein n=1 Tax=Panagrellus redivivus TaxID=6233 RepID=A0A7E4VQX0_PANRE